MAEILQRLRQRKLVQWAKLDPVWDPLRSDPRFQKLVADGEAAITPKPQVEARQ
ncbi:MAG TPA: hypothetical protein VHF02_05610 [Luteimonas sp.]|nr:hypothetical protein [Luteimonas sp.]